MIWIKLASIVITLSYLWFTITMIPYNKGMGYGNKPTIIVNIILTSIMLFILSL